MKQTGILFKPDLIRAIMDGTKTQTRRKITGLPEDQKNWEPCEMHYLQNELKCLFKHKETDKQFFIKSRLGTVGDLLYVKESYFILEPEHAESWNQRIVFRVNCPKEMEEMRSYHYERGYLAYKWKTPLFMKRDYARTWAIIRTVRIERLKDISEADAKAEGVKPAKINVKGKVYKQTYREAFFSKWIDINGIEDLDENPLVWVITFEKIETDATK